MKVRAAEKKKKGTDARRFGMRKSATRGTEQQLETQARQVRRDSAVTVTDQERTTEKRHSTQS